jgi:hypothetical protein
MTNIREEWYLSRVENEKVASMSAVGGRSNENPANVAGSEGYQSDERFESVPLGVNVPG